MALKGFTRNFKPLEILTEEQVEAIHRGTLEVLWVTGMRVEHQRALKLFEKNGCQVDYDNMRVRIPPALVEECLRKAPSSFHVKARDPKNDLMIGGNTLYFRTFPGMQTVDLNTWEARVAKRKENYDGVTVLDALDNLHLLGPYTPFFGFEGVPPAMGIPESCAAKMRNSTKVQYTSCSQNCEIFTIKMAKAVGVEVIGSVPASPPLAYYRDPVEAAFRFIEAGFPVYLSSGTIYGGTAPATLAGATVNSNAEIIAGVVLAQLIGPGTRVLVNDLSFPQNMQTGSPAFGAIGISLHAVMFNQLWRKYEIPIHNSGFGSSSSKKIDFQCGYEKAIGTLIAALSGGNIICSHGGMHGELTYHSLQAILDDDMAGMVGRFMQGVKVNDDTLAIDLIEEVGPIPGHFLNKEHTRKWWKLEQFVPKAADRLTYPEWMTTGKKACLDYAKERMEEILATHKPTPLTHSQEEDVEKILEEARKYYRERDLISEEEMATYRESMKSPNYPFG